MNIPAIYKLDNTNVAKDSIYGNKVGVLSNLVSNDVNVPDGYYFTITQKRENNEKYNQQLEEIFNGLKKTEGSKLIVRSSMSVEDRILHQFPGIFLSIKDVTSKEELDKAIRDCNASKDSELALRYVDPHKLVSLQQIKVSILVQEQIPIKYFGLAEIPRRDDYHSEADFITVEITRKDSYELVKGKITPSCIRIYKEGNYTELSNSENINFLDINLQLINRELRKIKKILKYDCIVEFGIDVNGNVYIFQAREHEIKGINPLRAHIPHEEVELLNETKTPILENEDEYGLKGAAMCYFVKNNLFEEPLLLIESKNTLNSIKVILNSNPFCMKELTLRFSKGDEIGLKRIFASNKETAFKEIQRYFPEFKLQKQLLIIHPYLQVKHSYELLIGKNFFVLEHIPGLWEANNVLEPDVIYSDLETKKVEILIVKDSRQQIISNPYSTDREFVPPLTFDFLESRLKKFMSFYEKLQNDFKTHLPLNFHFVETDTGKIAFLNIRRLNIKREMFENRRYIRDGSFFHVRNESDLEGWDGRSPILLRLVTERGKEKEFISLALKLPKNVDIFINFGWLSHPAMILREYGVHVIPAYLDRNIKSFDYGNNR